MTPSGGKVREKVEFAYLYGMSTVDDTVESAKKARQGGFDTFKMKVGGYDVEDERENDRDFDRSLRYDTDRVVAAADACPELSFRIDANQSWSRTDALRAISRLESEGVALEYLEQPLPLGNVESMETLTNRTTIPIAINEDSYFSFNLVNFIKRDAIDAAVLDLVPLGGVFQTKQLAERAGDQNISVSHHCCFDLGIKTAAILHLVASTPAFNLDNDTVYYAFQDHLIEDPFRFEEGSLKVRDKPGLGIQVDEEKLKEYSTVT